MRGWKIHASEQGDEAREDAPGGHTMQLLMRDRAPERVEGAALGTRLEPEWAGHGHQCGHDRIGPEDSTGRARCAFRGAQCWHCGQK
jgi:hypothetical protein